MRIIKEGKLPKEEEFETTCKYCKTIFVFTESELIDQIYPREGNKYDKVICPLCFRDCVVRI